jgi:hypothetical protein
VDDLVTGMIAMMDQDELVGVRVSGPGGTVDAILRMETILPGRTDR